MDKQLEMGLSLLLVTTVHAGVVTGVLWPQQVDDSDRTPPRVEGILIAAAPAERFMAPPVQQQPSLQPQQPQPQPAEPPSPAPKPISKPKPKPRPTPIPAVETASERAIEVPEAAPESMPETAQSSLPAIPPQYDDRLAAPAASRDEAAPDIIPPQPQANPRNNPAPEYPTASRRMREEGTVLLELMVEADGSVSAIRVQTSSGFPRLDASAMKTVRRWRFIPAMRGGKPVAYRFVQPIEFALN